MTDCYAYFGLDPRIHNPWEPWLTAGGCIAAAAVAAAAALILHRERKRKPAEITADGSADEALRIAESVVKADK